MSRTFRLNKLVRDNIVGLNEEFGARVDYTTLEGSELQRALVAKMIEEAGELLESKRPLEEIADLQEALDQFLANAGITKEEVVATQKDKNTQNGAFTNGHFVEALTLPEGNEWIDYYVADPEKYPEITHE